MFFVLHFVLHLYQQNETNNLKPRKMETTFTTLKNGKVANNVWANSTTKEIVCANKNSFGFNYLKGVDKEFESKYKTYEWKSNAPKKRNGGFSFSAKQMQEAGFSLIKRGDLPLW